MTEYQKRMIEIIKKHSEIAFRKFPEVVKELHLKPEDIIALAHVESSLGYDKKLCKGNKGGLFQLFSLAEKDAQSYVLTRHPSLIGDLYLASELKRKLPCEDGHVKLSFWEQMTHYFIEELLAYFGVLASWEAPRVNELDQFEKIVLLYHVGSCLRVIEGKPKSEWNKLIKECIKKSTGKDVSVDVLGYLKKLRRAREGFF